MTSVSCGDLSISSQVASKDEIGILSNHFNKAIYELSRLVGNIKMVSDHLSTTSQVLASTSEEVSASAEEVSKLLMKLPKALQVKPWIQNKGSS